MDQQVTTFNEEEREKFGGDYAITRTVPRIHPKTGRPLPGTRRSIRGGASLYRSFFRGDIIRKDNPEGDFNFALWNDDGTPESRRHWMTLTLQKGFKVCQADEWSIHPDLQGVYEVENGCLVLRGGVNVLAGGIKPVYEVVMWRTRARLEEEEREMNPMSQDTVAAKAQENLGNAITDKGVSPLPTQVEEISHRYVPD